MISAEEIFSRLREAGIRITADGDLIRVEPRAAMTEELRQAIRKDRSALLAFLQDNEPLLALVRQVAALYGTPPGELETMERLALANPSAAWECFTTDLATWDVRNQRGRNDAHREN